ncbi:MAG: M48 family metalloprotease [Candidatus Methanoperedens sp.]|nr:M48 family metalloprotease [Candidatus Methanoperedens sp.]MCE8425066.1 M48 family metalloprotease [Candidatus Methanoperedens sp.]MCE8426818.1 M48 family metalloprotease [Candidatus Methanoperedens sp.]
MNIIGEINCFGFCLRLSELAPYVALLIVIAIALFAARLIIKRPEQKLLTLIGAQLAILSAIAAAFYLMKCSDMLTIHLYLAYAGISLFLIFGVLRFYDRIMIKRLGARPAREMIGWTQEFVDKLTNATVYYYDSAVPKAFAAGRSIFLSLGLLELLNDDEIKAVLAHESWHIRNNSRMPFLKQLALMTFSPQRETDIEDLADYFAAKIAGSDALFSARSKLDKIFN